MSRDTQFQGFAKAILLELAQQGHINYLDCMNEEMVSIVARRAYDLVEHALDNAPVREWIMSCRASDIPDMTELSKED